jgi:hypothetical protein
MEDLLFVSESQTTEKLVSKDGAKLLETRDPPVRI